MNASGKLRAFLSLPRLQQAWLLPVFAMLGLSRLLILLVPFRRIAPRLGIHGGTTPSTPLLEPHQEQRARNIGRVVRLAARYTPWQSNCFPQAIVARLVLGMHRIPYSLFLGLARDGAEVRAHAWVTAGRVGVTGGHSFDQFTVVACFSSRSPKEIHRMKPHPYRDAVSHFN